MSNKPLIPDFEHTDTRVFQDQYLVIAQMIEQSMIESGAIPGVDYSRLDLFKLAQPFVLEQVKKGDLNV